MAQDESSGLTSSELNGRTIGTRYRLDKFIGRGGAGSVYRAYDNELGRDVALKILHPELTGHPRFQKLLRREVNAGRSVAHPNVVKVFDFVILGNHEVVSMELIEGESLLTVLGESIFIVVEEALKIAKGILGGLEAIHRAGIVHCDLKPANILISQEGRVVITDFGLARWVDPDLSTAPPNEGTRTYMSPEQHRGAAVDARSDLYSFGVILFEMLHGRRPADPAVEPDPQHGIPERINRILERCMAEDPNERYSSASEVLEALDSDSSRKQHRAKLVWFFTGLIVVVAAIGLWKIRGDGQNSTGAASPTETSAIEFHVFDGPPHSERVTVLAKTLSATLAYRLRRQTDLEVWWPDRKNPKGSSASIPLISGELTGDDAHLVLTITISYPNIYHRVVSKVLAGSVRNWQQLEADGEKTILAAILPSNSAPTRSLAAPEISDRLDAEIAFWSAERDSAGHDLNGMKSALASYNEAIVIDPRFALAYAHAAQCDVWLYHFTREMKYLADARSAAETAYKRDDESAQANIALGEVSLEQGLDNEAMGFFEAARDLEPRTESVYAALGTSLNRRGLYQEAVKSLQAAVRLNPLNSNAHRMLGAALLEIPDYDEAIKEFQKCVDLDPTDSTSATDIGATYIKIGQYSQAMPWLEKVVERSPQAGAFANLGLAYLFTHRSNLAIIMLEKACSLAPKADQYTGLLAGAYRSSGNSILSLRFYKKALEQAKAANATNHNDVAVIGRIALYFAELGNTREAEANILRARMKNPTSLDLMYYEGIVRLRAGEYVEAKSILKRVAAKGYRVAYDLKNNPDLVALRDRREHENGAF